MDAARHKRVGEVFLAVVDLPRGERTAVLTRACAGDGELRAAVERLLTADGEPDSDDLFDDARLDSGRQLLEELLDEPTVEPSTSWPPAGTRVGKFEIQRKLGEGGMGSVHLARQDRPGRLVALKLIRPGRLTPTALKRFHREVEVLGRLAHPGIAQIHEAGELETPAGRAPYFAMEFVDGPDLATYARREGLGTAARIELIARARGV